MFQSNNNGEADCVGVARGGAESVYKSRSFRVQDRGRVGGMASSWG